MPRAADGALLAGVRLDMVTAGTLPARGVTAGEVVARRVDVARIARRARVSRDAEVLRASARRVRAAQSVVAGWIDGVRRARRAHTRRDVLVRGAVPRVARPQRRRAVGARGGPVVHGVPRGGTPEHIVGISQRGGVPTSDVVGERRRARLNKRRYADSEEERDVRGVHFHVSGCV